MDKNKGCVCPQCNLMFSQKSLLEKHMKTHVKFRGDLINNKTGDTEKLKMQSKSPNTKVCKLSCLQCDFTTSRKASLTNHIRKHNAGNNKRSTEKELAEQSKIQKNYASELSCLQCEFTTNKKSSLTNHIRKHSNGNNKKSTEKELNELSEYQKSDMYELSCLQCDFTTIRKSSLTNHIRKHSSQSSGNNETSVQEELTEQPEMKNNDDSKLSCNQCNFTTTRKLSLANHIRKHNAQIAHFVNCHEQGKAIQPETKRFACTECDFKCNSNIILREHKEEHNIPTSFLCHICSAECIDESALKSHVAAHTENRILTLPAQGNNLNQKQHCQNSNKATDNNVVPEKDKSYKCSYCGNKFDCPQHLKWHIITHGNKKYFDCVDCEFKTIYERSLKLHRIQHSCKNLFACSECDFKTKMESVLLTHINNHKENRFKLKKFRNCTTTSELSLKCSNSSDNSAAYASLNQPTTHTKNQTIDDIDENTKNSGQIHLANLKKTSDIMQQNIKERATNEVLGPVENTSVTLSCEVKDCKETFTSQRYLRRHMQSHTVENMHKCTICSYKSYSKYSLKRHEDKHRSHICTECVFSCSSLEELNIHKQVHQAQIDTSCNLNYQTKDSKKVIKMNCDRCNSLFSTKFALKRHQRSCARNLFKYNLCDYKNTHLAIHEEKPHGQPRLKCNMCSFETLDAVILESHKIIHNVMTKKSSKAEKLDTKSSKNCISSVDMANVDKMQTNMTKKSFRTMKSKFKLSSKDQNSLSMTMPNINGKITCSVCNFTFETKSGLYKHIKTHYGENTFSCPKCPYKTHYSYNLKLHLEIHRFSRLLCLVCDYKCEKLIDLNNHMIEKHNLVHKTNTMITDHTVKEEIEICDLENE